MGVDRASRAAAASPERVALEAGSALSPQRTVTGRTVHAMTDYLVVSTDPDERGARPVVDETVLRRLLRATVFERRPAEPCRPGSPVGHCRYAQHYED